MFKTTIEYILAKIRVAISESETELYTVRGRRYKQLFELINDGRKLRDLVKKISLNLSHFVDKSRLADIHDRASKKTSSAEEKEKQKQMLDKEIKMNEKYSRTKLGK